MKKKIIVCGGSGFIGHHLVRRLKKDGHHVEVVDLKMPDFNQSFIANRYHISDLRDTLPFDTIFANADEVYQLAADMGGAGYLFTGEHDADVMHNSAMVNLKVLEVCRQQRIPKVFFSSSACVYQDLDEQNRWHVLPEPLPTCRESDAYPANPDSEYGWEKLFSERLYAAYARNYGLQVRIARFHNVFGPYGTYDGGREKAPAALCRKVAQAEDGSSIDIWGDGKQERSFLYVDECVEGIVRLMASDFQGPVNIGSDRMVTIDQLAKTIVEISGKTLSLYHIDGPIGVRGRNSDNTLIQQKLGWAPLTDLWHGLRITYEWIETRVDIERGQA